MHNLTKYNIRTLWQYYRNEPILTDAGGFVNLHAANNSALFKFKQKITGKTDYDNGRKNVEIMVPLKYLNNFRTPVMSLINC